MTHIPDLSPCTYFGDEPSKVLTAIGWLSRKHSFEPGEVSVEFFAKLVRLLNHPAPQPWILRGSQPCELCQFTGATVPQQFSGMPVTGVGHLQLFVPSGKFLFIASESIAHAVDAHRYQPPQEFIAAVLACPEPDTMEFKNQFLERGGRFLMNLARKSSEGTES